VFSPEFDFILYKVFATVLSRHPLTTFPASSLVLEMINWHCPIVQNAAVARMQAYMARPACVIVGDTNVIESARYYCRF
jgi:hypothetical protein